MAGLNKKNRIIMLKNGLWGYILVQLAVGEYPLITDLSYEKYQKKLAKCLLIVLLLQSRYCPSQEDACVQGSFFVKYLAGKYL